MKHSYFLKLRYSILAVAALLLTTVCWAFEDKTSRPFAGDYDFLAVKDISIVTSMARADDENYVDWTGEGYHSGVQTAALVFYACKTVPKDFVIPDNPTYNCTIVDAYGDTVETIKESLKTKFTLMKVSNKYSSTMASGIGVSRGGAYKLLLNFSPDMFAFEHEMILKDEACARVSNTKAKVGDMLCPVVEVTSGYPYDVDAIAGNKAVKWSVSQDGQADKIIEEEEDTIYFDTTKPLLAAVDTLLMPVLDQQPGKYIFTMTSADFAPLNRTFEAIVSDTLRADVTLDKQLYRLDTDTVAKLKVAMNFGYPYIEAAEEGGLPTITVSTEMLDQAKYTKFSDAAWATTTLDYTAEVEVPLTAIANDDVKDNDGEIPLTIKVEFNGETQYQALIGIAVEGSAGVEAVDVDAAMKPVEYYNTQGVKVDKSYRGIVVTNDGRKILR
jgi:hypothetical protein